MMQSVNKVGLPYFLNWNGDFSEQKATLTLSEEVLEPSVRLPVSVQSNQWKGEKKENIRLFHKGDVRVGASSVSWWQSV